MYMKSAQTLLKPVTTSTCKKTSYRQASLAIQKKLAEIKLESRMTTAVNNNLSLFRYRV
jgi:D-aminopeptidase